MGSVADAFRGALRERLAALTPDERIAIGTRLAEEDLDVFCAARHLPRDEGRRRLQARRSAGRRHSCLNEVDA